MEARGRGIIKAGTRGGQRRSITALVSVAAMLAACGGGFAVGTGGVALFATAGGATYGQFTGGSGYWPNGYDGPQLSAAEAQGMLDAHNSWRAAVDVPPLVWSTALASYEQTRLSQLAASCTLQHNPDTRYGENLFSGAYGYYDSGSAVAFWAGEKSLYTGEAMTTENVQRVGHYTQMVWRKTTALGCASVACGNTLLVGCAYSPSGNVVGERPY